MYFARSKPKMTAVPIRGPKTGATDLIDYAIEAHGARRVLFRALAALVTRKKAALSIGILSPYLRRDIGMPAEPCRTQLRGPHLL